MSKHPFPLVPEGLRAEGSPLVQIHYETYVLLVLDYLVQPDQVLVFLDRVKVGNLYKKLHDLDLVFDVEILIIPLTDVLNLLDIDDLDGLGYLVRGEGHLQILCRCHRPFLCTPSRRTRSLFAVLSCSP